MKKKILTPHDHACELASVYRNREMNEADTRHKIIDELLHSVLCWPKNAVDCESYIDPGYADYKLKRNNGSVALFVEAKKQGVYFNLPVQFEQNSNAKQIQIKTLLTDPTIKQVMAQVKEYCLEEGCEYAAITNGHEWIFFKVFTRGKVWKNLHAFVVRSLDYFAANFIEAVNNFSYLSVVENGSLAKLLGSEFPLNRPIYYPKEKINSFDNGVGTNRLANVLRPIADQYFGVINENDYTFMQKCYVGQREYINNVKAVNTVIKDSLSPYFKQYSVKDFYDDEKGGKFGKRLSENVINRRSQEVIILFGGKGSGKSTFLRKLLNHNPPIFIRQHARIALIDLLKTPEEKTIIHEEIWGKILYLLDQDGILEAPRDELIILFRDKFAVAEKQVLFGLDETSEAYNIKLNSLIESWLSDKKYCAKILSSYWKSKKRGLIIVLDNTDQYSREMQDYCFSIAQEISSHLGCLVIISMREERFYNSKIHGILDAYQNSGFHITSPLPQLVFKKRILYILDLLKGRNNEVNSLSHIPEYTATELNNFFVVIFREFTRDASALNQFIEACTHGDIRLALDLFRGFLTSGYTNVEEMVTNLGFKLQIHQVLKPMMVPHRFFYDESKSNIPNIYRPRSKVNSSHFTALRILRRLDRGSEAQTAAYVPVATLRSFFADTMNMLDDFNQNLDILLKYGFVESNNRIDEYDEFVDTVKITPYGTYMLQSLSTFFPYLDLISFDTGVFNEETANYLVISANEDLNYFLAYKKYTRIIKRLEKAEEFIKYLSQEEQRELELYSMEDADNGFMSIVEKRFEKEKIRTLTSAKKYKRAEDSN